MWNISSFYVFLQCRFWHHSLYNKVYRCCLVWVGLWSNYIKPARPFCVYMLLRNMFLLFLGLETFSQLVYEDEYGAVSDHDRFFFRVFLIWFNWADLNFIFRKASTQHQSVTPPDLHIEASCWTPLATSCPSKSSWLHWWAFKAFFLILFFPILNYMYLLFFVHTGNHGDEQN